MDGDVSDGGDNGDTGGEAAGSDLHVPRSARGSSSAHHRDGVAVDHDQQTRPTQPAQFDSSQGGDCALRPWHSHVFQGPCSLKPTKMELRHTQKLGEEPLIDDPASSDIRAR